jgi:hypothetical protein
MDLIDIHQLNIDIDYQQILEEIFILIIEKKKFGLLPGGQTH